MAKCPRCGEEYNDVLCEKCGYTPFSEDEPGIDKEEPLTEPENPLIVQPVQQDDSSCTSRYVWSCLIPVVGIILGSILLSKPDKNSRSSGTFCLIWSILGVLVAMFIWYIWALN